MTVEELIRTVGPDGCQTARQVLLEMVRRGITRFQQMHEFCDANDLLLRAAHRHGLYWEDLADDDYQLANGICQLADWLGTGQLS